MVSHKTFMNAKTIEFLGLWENLFKLVEFDKFKNEAGANAFVLSPQKWMKNITYASEADLLNVTLFGTTAKEWRLSKYTKVCDRWNEKNHAK